MFSVPIFVGVGFDLGGLVVGVRVWVLLDLDKEEAVGLLSLSSDAPELSVFFRSGGGGCGELADFASEAAVGAYSLEFGVLGITGGGLLGVGGNWRGEVDGVLDLLTGVGVCFGVSVGGFRRVDDGGRTGVEVGVLDLRVVREVGLDCDCAEVDVLRSCGSA